MIDWRALSPELSGDILEGLIIGHGGPAPDDCGSTRTVAVDVTLIDSLDRRNTGRIKLPVIHDYGR